MAVELSAALAEESMRVARAVAAVAVIGSCAEPEVIAGCERFQANDFETETAAAAEIEDRATSDDERGLEAGVVRGTDAAVVAGASISAAALVVVVAAAA